MPEKPILIYLHLTRGSILGEDPMAPITNNFVLPGGLQHDWYCVAEFAESFGLHPF
jgi:hypothetical protein